MVFPPRLDSMTSRDAEAELKVCLEGGAQKIIGNFAGTDYVSSAGLRVLFYVAKELKKNNGSIVLTSLNRFILELSKLPVLPRCLQYSIPKKRRCNILQKISEVSQIKLL